VDAPRAVGPAGARMCPDDADADPAPGPETQEGESVAAERFLQLADVAEVLNISSAQVYALVRSGELPAIKIGGRGQWRVEASELENYITRMYAETRDFVTTHPLGRGDGESAGDAEVDHGERQADRDDA
jgi:excisionase family DNA binding protein